MRFAAVLALSLCCCANMLAQAPIQAPSSPEPAKTPTPAAAQPATPSATPAAIPVAIKAEPHHHLTLENAYVRVYRVEIISPDATLLHLHDFPYAYMSIGHAEFTNAVEGKPEVRIQMDAGQLGYSKGGFSHLIRTIDDTPFYNITIELLQPQGNVINSCAKIMEGPLQACPDVQIPVNDNASPVNPVPNAAAKSGPPAPPAITLVLETEGSTWKTAMFSAKASYPLDVPAPGILLVIAPLSQFNVEFADGSSKLLSGGDPLWLLPGSPVVITNISEQKPSALMLFNFKPAPKSASN